MCRTPEDHGGHSDQGYEEYRQGQAHLGGVERWRCVLGSVLCCGGVYRMDEGLCGDRLVSVSVHLEMAQGVHGAHGETHTQQE